MISLGFFAVSGGLGSTMLSVSTSKILADMGNRVLLIFSGTYNQYAYVEKNNAGSLDDIRLSLIAGTLTDEELVTTVKKVDDIEILTSNRSFLLANTFPVDSFEKIFKRAKDFDYVIVDGGADFRTALTISALRSCDKKIISITQQPNSILQFKELDNVLFDKFGGIEVVINKFMRDKSLYSADDVAYLLKRGITCVIPFSQFGNYAQIERRTLIGEKRYRRAVEDMILKCLDKVHGKR